MAYSPDPDRRPIPRAVLAVVGAVLAASALFTFAPVIVRALMNGT